MATAFDLLENEFKNNKIIGISPEAPTVAPITDNISIVSPTAKTHFEELMETRERPIEIKSKGNSSNFLKKMLISALSISAIAFAGFHLYQNYSKDLQLQPTIAKEATVSVIQSSTKEEAKTIESTHTQLTENQYKVNIINGVSEEKRLEIENSGNFDLDKSLKDNQISRVVAQKKLSSKDYFSSLVSETEGFRSVAYNDNIGIAFGNGWNMSMQSKVQNKRIAEAIYSDAAVISKITTFSGKNITDKINGSDVGISIAPQQAIQVANIMKMDFEKSAAKVIGSKMPSSELGSKSKQEAGQQILDKLKPNEKAAIIDIVYKVGEYGFSKYENLNKNLIKYAQTGNLEAKEDVAKSIAFKYKLNGKELQDERASALIQAMWSDSQNYAYLIKSEVKPLPNFKVYRNNNGDVSSQSITKQSIDDLPDPLGEEMKKIAADPNAKFEGSIVYDHKILGRVMPTKGAVIGISMNR